MFDPRQAHRSSYRTVRADVDPATPPSVSSPAGAADSTTVEARAAAGGGTSVEDQVRQILARSMSNGGSTAGAQASALRKMAGPPAFANLPTAEQNILRSGYGAGSFEGVRNAAAGAGADWYDIPSHIRTQLLAGSRT